MELTFDAKCTLKGKPFVHVLIDGEVIGQLTPGEAKMLGTQVIASGIEAERDAGFLTYMLTLDSTPSGVPMAAAMLSGLREHRAQFDPQSPIYPNDPRVQ